MQKSFKRQIWLWGLSFILTLASWGLGMGAIADSLSNVAAPSPTALEVFRTAYENRYTWDDKFPGYAAAVELKQGGETYKGQVRIGADLSVEVTGIENEKVRDTLWDQLRMLITHRRQTPFSDLHKQHTFSFGETDASGAVDIDQQGNGTPSHYYVKEKKITQVNRFMGPVAVTVDLFDSQDTPEGYLGIRYLATFKYIQTGDEIDKLEFEDAYKKVGSYYIPTRQTIRHLVGAGQGRTAEINFTDIQLL